MQKSVAFIPKKVPEIKSTSSPTKNPSAGPIFLLDLYTYRE